MLSHVENIWNEPAVVHLGNHPYNNCMRKKRERQLAEGGNPLIEPESWHDFLKELTEKVHTVMKINEALEQEMAALCEE